jgi:hypothetical protein
MQSRLLLLTISGLAVSTGLAACGSSKSGTSPSTNSPDGSSAVFGSSGSSGSGIGAGSSSGTGGGGSGTGNASSSGSSGAGAAACTPPSTVPSSELLPYATVQQQLNACTSMEISALIAACVPPSGSPSKCQGWTPSNARCAACAMPTNDAGVGQNTGAMLFDVRGNLVDYNFGGCVALVDPTSTGLDCAQTLDTYVQCIDFACEGCTDQTSTNACQSKATQGGACSSYNDAYHTPCKTDLGVDGGGITRCSTGTQTINVICGTGM